MKYKTTVRLYGLDELFEFKSPGRLDIEADGEFIRLKNTGGVTQFLINQRELLYIVFNEEIPTV